MSTSDTSAGSVTHLLDVQMAVDAAETAPRSVKHGGVWSVTQSVSQRRVKRGVTESFSSPSTDGIQRKTSDCRSAFLFFFPLPLLLLSSSIFSSDAAFAFYSLCAGAVEASRDRKISVSGCGVFQQVRRVVCVCARVLV